MCARARAHQREELAVLLGLLRLRRVVRAEEPALHEAALLEAEGVDAVAHALILLEVGAAPHADAALRPVGAAGGGALQAQVARGLHHQSLCAHPRAGTGSSITAADDERGRSGPPDAVAQRRGRVRARRGTRAAGAGLVPHEAGRACVLATKAISSSSSERMLVVAAAERASCVRPSAEKAQALGRELRAARPGEANPLEGTMYMGTCTHKTL